MRLRLANFSELDRAVYRVTTAFLNGRLEERASIDWALRLRPNDTINRQALFDLLESPTGRKIGEPWRTAWRLIEESWNNPVIEDQFAARLLYNVKHRLSGGDRSGSLVAEIVGLVAARLKIVPLSNLHSLSRKTTRRPKKVNDLFVTMLTSAKIIDPDKIDLKNLEDQLFLASLAYALDSAVVSGMDIARRIGWTGENRFWKLGGLNRVYHVSFNERAGGGDEPDYFNRGIAPSVKLLHAVVVRLVDINIPIAVEFAKRWELIRSPIHLRLWAALSMDSRVTSAKHVGNKLISLPNHCFWDLDDYPEIAELRAKRFSEFDPKQQVKLMSRIRKLPPRNQWPRKADAARVKKARIYWAIREIRRIQVAECPLSNRDETWLNARIGDFPDLAKMNRLNSGFQGPPVARFNPPNPDNRYDLLQGEERLKSIEASLSSTRGGWHDDNAARASDWISENPLKILTDFESTHDGGASFSNVWERFGWTHSPEEKIEHNLLSESSRVLLLLARLPEETAKFAIDGISHWLSTWKKQIVIMPEGLRIWLKFWQIATNVTNGGQQVDEEIHLNPIQKSRDSSEPAKLDTLNWPVAKFVDVFIASCPSLQENDLPFEANSAPRRMRDAIIASTGRSKLIGLHRLIEQIPYFLSADRDWTHEHLINPLIADNPESLSLWRAIARQTRFFDVLNIIGNPMSERATDKRLARDTRHSLVFSLIVECLNSFKEKRKPAVSYTRIQQMIRSLDDEIRAHGAEAVPRFVASRHNDGSSPEDTFRNSAMPFLQQVWPQERSLATPGVSQALAVLPATAKGVFTEVVANIERFLVPFECWSMLEYGLYGENDGDTKLSIIDNQEKAAAFLRLLNLTIGRDEGSVIPYDLAEALDQIREVAPNLKNGHVFRRLATLTRRK